MAKIAIINIGLHGHVNPTIGFTEELIRRGHEIVYLGDPAFDDKVARIGARPVDYGTKFSHGLTSGLREKRNSSKFFVDEAESTLPNLLRLLEQEAPDAVVYDFISVSSRLVVEKLGIPSIKFFTTYAATTNANPLAKAFNVDMDSALEQELALRFENLCANFGLQKATIRELMSKPEADNLVFMPRSFHPENEMFDERFHFVGPCLRRADGLLAGELSLQGRSPLMLVSLGTLFHEWPEFYRDCIKAFSGQPWRVAMAVGTKTDIPALGKIPDNVLVRPHMPQLDLLALSELFVSHGGMNSTMEALYFGVPLVVIPQMEEQAFTARRIAEMNLGLHLDREQVTPETLLSAVQEVSASELMRENAAHLRNEVRAAGGTERAVAVIEKAAGVIQAVGTEQKPVFHEGPGL